MVKWKIDKSNKIPLYLQLKDLIKYYISTGSLHENNKLPGVNTLGEELGINFETVRKAYKELEKEGLLSMERGRGTYVTLHKASGVQIKVEKSPRDEPVEAVKTMVKRLMHSGFSIAKIKGFFSQALNEIHSESSKQVVVFTECNLHQVKEISKILKDYLRMNIRAVLVSELRDTVEQLLKAKTRILAVVTTGFHVNEVQKSLNDVNVYVHVLITRMSTETRRKLTSYRKKANFCFICRDRESIAMYRDLLKTELGRDMNLSCCVFKDRDEVNDKIQKCDALLVSPPVYDHVKKISPQELPVYNVFDNVEPMSMRLIKDRILEMI